MFTKFLKIDKPIQIPAAGRLLSPPPLNSDAYIPCSQLELSFPFLTIVETKPCSPNYLSLFLTSFLKRTTEVSKKDYCGGTQWTISVERSQHKLSCSSLRVWWHVWTTFFLRIEVSRFETQLKYFVKVIGGPVTRSCDDWSKFIFQITSFCYIIAPQNFHLYHFLDLHFISKPLVPGVCFKW